LSRPIVAQTQLKLKAKEALQLAKFIGNACATPTRFSHKALHFGSQ